MGKRKMGRSRVKVIVRRKHVETTKSEGIDGKDLKLMALSLHQVDAAWKNLNRDIQAAVDKYERDTNRAIHVLEDLGLGKRAR